MSPAVTGAVFAAGAGSGSGPRPGVVPLHVWLPRAHPEAPSHVSALMCAAMVKLGVYGVVRVGLDLLGGGPRWWWLVVLAAGAVSALFGILQAVVAVDLKRLLAYSTTENMGLILIGVGAARMLRRVREPAAGRARAGRCAVASWSITRRSRRCCSSAGSVLRATGSRDLDALGGLRSRMPVTTALFAVGALGASALPPVNGFVSEWLLLQCLIHALPTTATATAVAMPLAVAVVALTAGLAVATFVKAFGVGFLARPRSTVAEQAVESRSSMLAGAGLAAAGCVVLALAPAAVLPRLSRAASTAFGSSAVDAVHGPVTLRLTGYRGQHVAAADRGRAARPRPSVRWPVSGLLAARRARRVAEAVGLRRRPDVGADGVHRDVVRRAAAARLRRRAAPRDRRRRHPDRRVARTWSSASGSRPGCRTGSSIASTEPVLSASRAVGEAARGLANGSVHRYLAYGFVAFAGLLIVLAVTR